MKGNASEGAQSETCPFSIHSVKGTIVAAVLVIAAVVAMAFASQAFCDQYHAQYATGSDYTVSGYVQTASKKVLAVGRGTCNVYKVEIRTEEVLPDGTNVFESSYSEDYSKVSDYKDKPDTLVQVTINEKGYVAEVA